MTLVRSTPRSAASFIGDGSVAARHVTSGGTACRNAHGRAVHEHNVLALYTGGRARMEQRGLWELHPGDALLVPAGEPHRMLENFQAEYWGLAFIAPGDTAQGGASLLEPFERVRGGGAAVVRVPGERHELLHTLFRELARVSSTPPAADALDAATRHSLLTLILGEVARAARTAPPALAGVSGPGIVSQSVSFIERNCLRRLTLDEIAEAVGRSPAYVTTALSRATGRSASHWILAFRMAEARRLLLHSDLPMEAIAERIGYADSTHFVRMFRREHRHTPAAWRAERRSKAGGALAPTEPELRG